MVQQGKYREVGRFRRHISRRNLRPCLLIHCGSDEGSYISSLNNWKLLELPIDVGKRAGLSRKMMVFLMSMKGKT